MSSRRTSSAACLSPGADALLVCDLGMAASVESYDEKNGGVWENHLYFAREKRYNIMEARKGVF